MDKQYLSKKQHEKRIERLNAWIEKNPNDPMKGTAIKEAALYAFQLKEMKDLGLKTIDNKVPTQIYQQIGVLI
ncbi:hypothetical protein [Faecalibacter macacae]|uniref:Uncharacterized protein n=1 Tax=Faecalibacter macacae TaxID=1859289 RepID=A0A3L9M5Z1_9FLAO|nr:hypothetical protein [Faecalibacter macacae]RLZ08570.1 hypothetical protein EAH69_09655 [Faecalibacter macacae]